MKFLQRARLMQICEDHVIKAHCALQRGISFFQKIKQIICHVSRTKGFLCHFLTDVSLKQNNLCQRCTIFLESEPPICALVVITMKYSKQILEKFADLYYQRNRFGLEPKAQQDTAQIQPRTAKGFPGKVQETIVLDLGGTNFHFLS